jgi:hypothetical protein
MKKGWAQWAAIIRSIFLGLGLCSLLVGPVLAHKSSDSYLTLKVSGDKVAAQWDIYLPDIQFAIGLDENSDDQISWGELQKKELELQAWANSRLNLNRGGICTLQPTDLQVDEHTDGNYAVLFFDGKCPVVEGPFSIQYSLLFDIDTQHRGLLNLDLDGNKHSAVLGPQNASQKFTARESSGVQFLQYLTEGIWHIWIGFDHILFLICLLLPAVLLQGSAQTNPAPDFKRVAMGVLGIVSAFTLAHSITLSLAALEVVVLPSRWVESAIAGSVIFVAVKNLTNSFEGRWQTAFLFGLIHGFGFASVLTALGLPTQSLALSLVGFNLGVEFGQLVIVGIFIPLAFFLRASWFYQVVVFRGGSWTALFVALAWFVERAFQVSVFL